MIDHIAEMIWGIFWITWLVVATITFIILVSCSLHAMITDPNGDKFRAKQLAKKNKPGIREPTHEDVQRWRSDDPNPRKRFVRD